MSHPLEAIPSNKRLRVFLPLLISTLLLMGVFRIIGPAQPNIVDFELAGSVPNSQAIVNAWNESARIHAGFSLGIDYLFMPLYSTTIALACVWAASVIRSSQWRSAGILLAWGQWLAALFDATENVTLAVILFGLAAVDPWPSVAQICATIKFGLILIGLAYVAIGVIVRVTRRS